MLTMSRITAGLGWLADQVMRWLFALAVSVEMAYSCRKGEHLSLGELLDEPELDEVNVLCWCERKAKRASVWDTLPTWDTEVSDGQ